jgi:hypothetical protein
MFWKRERVEKPAREPSLTWMIWTDEAECTVAFEPVGSEFVLTPGERLRVHVYGRNDRPEDTDLEIHYSPGRVSVYILGDDYRVWNRAGEELRHL